MTDIAGLVGFLLLCILVAGVGGVVTAGAALTSHPSLRKPSWNPPAWLFGPVWTVLYHWGDWLWGIRGFIDLLLGGVGLRRGRRDPDHVRLGDVVDFWRVEGFEDGRWLRLVAEMKLPGRAWLEFEVSGSGEGRSMIRQTALFEPSGVAGLAYWYLLYPIHALVFRGMLCGIARLATAEQQRASQPART